MFKYFDVNEMSMQNKERKQGITAGISLVIMAIAAGFSYGYAHTTLVANSAENTMQNLLAQKSLFFAELGGWSIIFITDLIVAIALYFYFRSTSKQIAGITALIRISYTLVLGVAILQLFKIIPALASNSSLLASVVASEINSHFQLFEKLWSTGLILFGFHLIGLGYLSLKSKLTHRLLGYLLIFGGMSYSFIHGTRQLNLLDTNLINLLENVLAIPMALAEILLAFWLIYSGFRKSSPKLKS
ncbi:DUF4386 domain-containing protein [uncultured Draconibacterium sp.]|uniref:DUF4386 domain-containing protein n=1 Tax=uncultured Draconibacterium sp. TaxID=1573823 RepID=UPI003217E60D